jgi:agmatine/peptidylarginine deiminase
MKKISFYLLIVAFAFNLGRSYAQDNSPLIDNGLKHIYNESVLFNSPNPVKGILTTNPPVGPVRNIAEFEPAEAVVIAYLSSGGGFGLPNACLKDLSASKVYIICPSSNQSAATSALTSAGANTANCSFITVSAVDSWWTRDYTGWFIADSSNKVQVVDFTYNRNRPNDDAFTTTEASYFGITMYGMALTHTGGNWMTDGYYGAISTVLVKEENATDSSNNAANIRTKVLNYLGISNYQIVPDAQGQYIEHIDCWGKLLAPDKILIDSVPSTDAQYAKYNAAAAYFASTNCAYGYHYKVFRPLISGSSETNAEPYSNSFIFNNRVFVPTVGLNAAHDTAALNLYRKAMPGYSVKGYYASSSSAQAWLGTDALHCRTHEIADRQMLYIQHYPLYGKISSTTGYDINAKVVSYAGRAIATNYPTVIYKVNHGGQWDSIPMTLVGYHSYKGTIPTQTSGDTIFYYIKAEDVQGKLAYHALMGKADPHFFIADGPTGGINNLNIDPEMSFFTYPNPSKGAFYLFLKSNYSDKASIEIYNVTGNLVYQDNFEFETGSNKKIINLDNISQGVYILEVRTNSGISTKQLVIQ